VRKDVMAQVELLRDDAVVVASINNLSLGGAFLLHPDDDVAVGEGVRVHLAAGALTAVQEARVVRVRRDEPRGFAVAWIAPGAEVRALLELMLRHSLERSVSTLRDDEKRRGSGRLRP
jgi:hypothetical protein